MTLVVLMTIPVFANEDEALRKEVIHNGIGMGTVLAIVISWSRNNSVLWAFLHGILSWIYVIYFIITRENK
ncbi:hypothetical protein LZZ90_12980 [Flavobacterium sp. SM15]|uniref:hypothetical protein n=1 Tax=Flavobacterium sp. SM15 TaxID=2908005 RepID=UPI001ED9D849|nr:hypothetical protein [Flavobacterium sp. SM15]MCG2612422.1 hypothetical protein [Flavobacterium sp. SM15]